MSAAACGATFAVVAGGIASLSAVFAVRVPELTRCRTEFASRLRTTSGWAHRRRGARQLVGIGTGGRGS
jgi:hypothetical protein